MPLVNHCAVLPLVIFKYLLTSKLEVKSAVWYALLRLILAWYATIYIHASSSMICIGAENLRTVLNYVKP